MSKQASHSATFHFQGALKDFLRRQHRQDGLITYTFSGTPAIKDAIEAIGVPHPEVDVVLMQQEPVSFMHPLHHNSIVEVYPVQRERKWPQGYSFEERYPPPQRYVLDVHLGTLAKYMRMLGLDAFYATDLSDNDIARIAQEEQRVVLTRDVGLLKQKTVVWGYWLRSQNTMEQLSEVIRRYNLWSSFSPFARCLACNVQVRQVPKQEVLDELPPKTRLYFDEFYRCPSCCRIYWKGSHFERMEQYIRLIREQEH